VGCWWYIGSEAGDFWKHEGKAGAGSDVAPEAMWWILRKKPAGGEKMFWIIIALICASLVGHSASAAHSRVADVE